MPAAKAKKSRYIFLFLRIAVVICGIICGVLWVHYDVGWDNLVKTFSKLNPVIFAAALGIFAICQIIVGLRWWLLLRTQSIFIAFWTAVRLHFLGLFYNNFMPGSVGGDLIRAWYVTRHTDKKFEAALSVFVDRAIGLLSTVIIAVFFYSFFLRGKGVVIPSEKQQQQAFFVTVSECRWIIFWVLAAIVLILCGLSLHKQGRKILTKSWASIRVHSISIITRFKDAIVIYCSRPLAVLAVFVLTFFLQIITITGFWFLGQNMGIEASIKYYYVFFALTWVLGAVPVSIGGAVVVEGTLIYLFTHFAGVENAAAFTLALCQRLIWMLTSLPGAVIHLIGAHLPKDFFIDGEKPIN